MHRLKSILDKRRHKLRIVRHRQNLQQRNEIRSKLNEHFVRRHWQKIRNDRPNPKLSMVRLEYFRKFYSVFVTKPPTRVALWPKDFEVPFQIDFFLQQNEKSSTHFRCFDFGVLHNVSRTKKRQKVSKFFFEFHVQRTCSLWHRLKLFLLQMQKREQLVNPDRLKQDLLRRCISKEK